MKPHVSDPDGIDEGRLGADRRGKPRIYEPFVVKVAGIDNSGERFRFETALDNISSSGLYLHLPQVLEPGARLFLVVGFSPAATVEVLAPRFAMRGVVIRTEWAPDGLCGVAVAITSHRQL